MTGKSIGHYEVGEKLGAGGMGVVYHARDTKLERDVALKFLPTEWSRDEDAKRRFMQEARTASGLDHQNICTVYEIGETEDGQLFIVMPLYRGQTLKYRLKGGQLSVSESVSIIRQLLEGLATAHEAGIIHRDVKPANIMLADRGQVKLLDFGIAKLGAGIGLTQTGSTLGTAAYMSPEQTKGADVDKRADLWSAGVLFYEMLTGRRPFEADYEQAVIYGILNSQP
ncbi:MAG: serine/threonine-protein kinase, partial [Rhodothermia bacterium]